MSDTTEPRSDEERDALLAEWLATIPPAKAAADSMVSRIAPWRHGLINAIRAGYTWAQLAVEIAPKPEIGVKTTPENLRKCVRLAFARANESMPRTSGESRRRKRAGKSTDKTNTSAQS